MSNLEVLTMPFPPHVEGVSHGERKLPAIHSCVETLSSAKHPERNEDAYCVGKDFVGVFDTAGTSKNKIIAGQLVAAHCQKELSTLKYELSISDAQQKMGDIVRGAAGVLTDCAKKENLSEPLLTTINLAKVFTRPDTGQQFVVAVPYGDTRLLHISNGEIVFMTIDDSAVKHGRSFMDAYALQGKLAAIHTEEEKKKDPDLEELFNRRNEITRCLSSANPSPDICPIARYVQPGDIILIMSDGVHDNLTTDEILKQVAETAENPFLLPERLVALAKAVSEDPGNIRHKSDDMTAGITVV